MKIRGTDFIMFHVSDLDAAARFYRDDLGLPQMIYSEEYQWTEFDCGNVTLSLKGGTAPSAILAGTRLALAVDDISAACAELAAKGARLAGAPQDHGCCQSLEVRDPDGNVLILHHRADGTFGQVTGEARPAP